MIVVPLFLRPTSIGADILSTFTTRISGISLIVEYAACRIRVGFRVPIFSRCAPAQGLVHVTDEHSGSTAVEVYVVVVQATLGRLQSRVAYVEVIAIPCEALHHGVELFDVTILL